MKRYDVSHLVGKVDRPIKIPAFLDRPGFPWWTPNMLSEQFGTRNVAVEYSLTGMYHPRPDINKGRYFKKTLRLDAAIHEIVFGSDLGKRSYCSEIVIDHVLPELTEHLPDLRSIRNQAARHRVLFVGNSGTGSHFHYDLPDNVIVVFSGQKTMRFVSPQFTRLLDPYPSPFRFCNLSSKQDGAAVEVTRPLQSRYSYELVAGTGDAIYIPSGWWHRVENHGFTVSVSNLWPPKLMTRLFAWHHIRVDFARSAIGERIAARMLSAVESPVGGGMNY